MTFTRENLPIQELEQPVQKTFKGLTLTYNEVYYLDAEVDEDTGAINKERQVPHYTKEQTTRNLKALKDAYMIAKGAATPSEIISFRKKYSLAASTLSLILGFSKNTISNIENQGIHSLPSGRLIKICLNNPTIFSQYIQTSSFLDVNTRKELVKQITS
ncbi:MAG: transcriptional regulator, partial [Aureispira sp.]